MKLFRMFCWMIPVAFAANVATAAPLGPGFTYQGQLILNGNPVEGTTHLRFRLFNALTGGNQIGSAQTQPNVLVSNGVFTVILNPLNEFGPNAFNGEARWLEIAVCDDPACATSTTLTPRQAITATPYAHHSVGPWQSSGTSLSYLNGNVGIGRADPQAPLELQSGFGTEVLRFGYSSSNYHHITTGFHGEQAPLNFLGFNISHGHNDVRRILTLQGDGQVLVQGTVRLGTSGELFAPGFEENLRMLRGTVGANGAILQGSGFNVIHISTGQYQINYTTSFPFCCPTATANVFEGNARSCGIAITQERLNVFVRNGGGAFMDAPFSFIIVGPR